MTNPHHVWFQENTVQEVRHFDCLHSTEFVDPDPIPELFPHETMWYVATIFDPDTASAMPGITDHLDVLYRSKFGPGTPQAFLYETPIVGWVMYYQLGNTMWIVEIQGCNVLRGGVLGYATGRRHFYRYLLKTFLTNTSNVDTYVMLTYDEQERIHSILRPSQPLPPSAPYHGEVMRWCGFEKKMLSAVDVPLHAYQSKDLITESTKVWYFAPGRWKTI
jgi:hypothetical protein